MAKMAKRRSRGSAVSLSGRVTRALLTQAKSGTEVLIGMGLGVGALLALRTLDSAVPGTSDALLDAIEGQAATDAKPVNAELKAAPKRKAPRLKAPTAAEKVKEAVANGDVIDAEFTPL